MKKKHKDDETELEENSLSENTSEDDGERNKMTDILTLRRTAGEVRRHKVIVRIISILVIVLVALVAVAYAVS